MKKILYVDIWDKGYRNFTRIDDTFKKNGYTSLLVHTGSFFNNDVTAEEYKEDLLVRDICFYKTILIKKVLEVEKPDVVIILNLSFVFDRSVVNICKWNNIKLVYLSHGKLISSGFVEEEAEKLDNTIKKSLSRIVSKKNLFVLLNYLSSLNGGKIFLNPIKLFWGILKEPSNYLTFAKYDEELDADLVLVYTEDDRDLLVNKFGFQDKKIKIIGNPEITKFLSAPTLLKLEFLKTLGFHQDINYLVYLDDGFANDKSISVDEWYSSLSEIVRITDSLGLMLIMKLHPRTNREEHLAFFESKNIISVIDCDFKNLLVHSDFVVSHLSTTITYALIFNKNVFIPYWGKFAELWKNYPENVVKYCYSPLEFKESILLNTNGNQDNIQSYLLDNGIDIKVNSINKIFCEVSRLV